METKVNDKTTVSTDSIVDIPAITDTSTTTKEIVINEVNDKTTASTVLLLFSLTVVNVVGGIRGREGDLMFGDIVQKCGAPFTAHDGHDRTLLVSHAAPQRRQRLRSQQRHDPRVCAFYLFTQILQVEVFSLSIKGQ